jgi:hypothetical protein
MYTIFSAVQRQQRKSDVMMSFGLTACSAIYYQLQVPHWSHIFVPILAPDNPHLAPDLKIELEVGFHIPPKSDICIFWLEKLLLPFNL